MVQIKDLKFHYTLNEENEVKHILKNLNMEIKRGEFVAVLGRNGSGKSTLGKLINCLLRATEGTLHVGGLDASKDENLWKIREMAGMVFQNPDNQIVATIVEEDVAFGPENLGIPTAEIHERVDKALMTVGMERFRLRPPHLLSGGQKQRVSIAGVLAMEPSLIIFDEPTAMLDPKGRKDVLDTIKSLHQRGITILYITHFMDEVVEADRLFVMDDGQVALTGKPNVVFNHMDKMKDLGLDVPQAMAIIDGLRKKGVEIPTTIMTVKELGEYYANQTR